MKFKCFCNFYPWGPGQLPHLILLSPILLLALNHMFWPWFGKQKNRYVENVDNMNSPGILSLPAWTRGGWGGRKKQKRNIEVRITQFTYRFKCLHSSPKDYEWPIDLNGKQFYVSFPKQFNVKCVLRIFRGSFKHVSIEIFHKTPYYRSIN